MSRTQKHPTHAPSPRRHPSAESRIRHARHNRPPTRRHGPKTQSLPHNLQLLFLAGHAEQLRRHGLQPRDGVVVDLRLGREGGQRDGGAVEAGDVDLAAEAGEDFGGEARGVGGEDGVAVVVAVQVRVPARGAHDERVARQRRDGDGEGGGGEEGCEHLRRPGAGGDDEAGAGDVGFGAGAGGQDAEAG